jgi:hypothetical protein
MNTRLGRTALVLTSRPDSVAPIVFASGLLLAIASRDARADVAQASLVVVPSAEASACADADALAAAANRDLRRRAFDAGGQSGSPSQFEVEYSRNESGYVATVRERGIQHAERTLESGEALCEPLTAALGVTLAMMLDSAGVAGRAEPPPPLAAAPDRPAPATAAPGPFPAGRTAYDGVFLEGLGNGVYDSVNYERLFWGDRMSVRVGFGFARVESKPYVTLFSLSGAGAPSYWFTELTLPVVVNSYWGTASHKLQIGVGATAIYRTGKVGATSFDEFFSEQSAQGFDVAGTAVLAYRFLPYRGGPSFGVGFTPLFGRGGFLPWLAANLGADF